MKINSSAGIGISARRNLAQADALASKNIRNIASGKRINKAGDDASGLAIAQKLLAQLSGSGAAAGNTQDAISMVRTADSALGTVSEIAGRMNELAAKAGNGLLGSEERQSLQDEFDQLSQEIDRIGQSSAFNGNKLFDGSSYDMQVGENASDTRRIQMAGISSAALGLDSVDLGGAEGARKALESIRSARDTVSSRRGDLGAAENGMRSAYNNNANRQENLAAGVSRLADADIARESTKRHISNVLQQTSLAMLSQSRNLAPYNALALLR